ncbi:ABC transporter substrate-binding protein [bacterium]|nr:ABC transporter substrate-binding protein [bacterium]
MNISKWNLIPLVCILLSAFVSCGHDTGFNRGPVKNKIYNFPCSSEISTLDPALASNMSEESIICEIFDSLVTLDNDLNIIPEIAQSWEYDSESATYTFHIRKGIKFHDGGILTANDVKASFTRLINPDIKARNSDWAMWIKGTSAYSKGESEDISGLRVTDNFTIEIQLHEAYIPFIDMLTTSTFSIMPSKLAERSVDNGEFIPVGSGPFIYVKTRSDGSVALKANDMYYSGSPKLDGILFRVIKEPSKMIEEYRKGNLHHTWVFPELAEKILADETIAGQIQTYPINAMYFYAFNLDKLNRFGGSKENKRLLRQAINYAVDRETICRDVFMGRCVQTGSVIPSGICGYSNPLSERLGFERDPVKARELLEQAGYANGEDVGKVSLFTTYESPNIEIAEIFKNNLGEIGLDVEIVAKDKENYLKAVQEGDPALFSYEWYMQYPNVDNIFSMFHTENADGGQNFARMTRDYIDSIIDEYRQCENADERQSTYTELERQLTFDAPWVFMFHLKNAILVNPEVEGLLDQLGQFDYRESISHVRMEKVDLVFVEEKE